MIGKFFVEGEDFNAVNAVMCGKYAVDKVKVRFSKNFHGTNYNGSGCPVSKCFLPFKKFIQIFIEGEDLEVFHVAIRNKQAVDEVKRCRCAVNFGGTKHNGFVSHVNFIQNGQKSFRRLLTVNFIRFAQDVDDFGQDFGNCRHAACNERVNFLLLRFDIVKEVAQDNICVDEFFWS